MTCPQCGATVSFLDKVCPRCGTALPERTDSQASNPYAAQGQPQPGQPPVVPTAPPYAPPVPDQPPYPQQPSYPQGQAYPQGQQPPGQSSPGQPPQGGYNQPGAYPPAGGAPSPPAPGGYNAPGGYPQGQGGYPPNYNSGAKQGDAPNFGWALVGFLFPLIGLIMYLASSANTPLKARSALRGAGLGFGLGAVGGVLAFLAMMVGGMASMKPTVTTLSTMTSATASAPSSGRSSNSGTNSYTTSDVQFAQDTFTSLVNADQTVANSLDWDHLMVQGKNGGQSYQGLPSNDEKAQFRSAFITSYSQSYKKTGAVAESFRNWRLDTSDADTTTVMADGGSGTLYVVVSHAGGSPKVSNIHAEKS